MQNDHEEDRVKQGTINFRKDKDFAVYSFRIDSSKKKGGIGLTAWASSGVL